MPIGWHELDDPDLRPDRWTIRTASERLAEVGDPFRGVLVQDQPGMLADVARVLADEKISIASVIQHEAQEDHQGDVVPLVIMTHYAETGRFRKALGKIDTLSGVVPPGVHYSVDD